MLRQGVSWSGHEPNCCFLNSGKRGYLDVSAASGFDFPDDGRGMALVDWDHDGDLDVWINNRTAPQIRYLRNDVPTGNHFLALRLEGRECNRDAIGARVEVKFRAKRGKSQSGRLSTLNPQPSTLIKTLRAGDGYLAQSSKWLHFGLGDAAQIERVVVHWPGGRKETFDGLQADQRYEIVQGADRPTIWPVRAAAKQLTPSQFTAPASSDQVQVFSSSRIPVPQLAYETFGGQAAQVTTGDIAGQAKRPVLLNLWASWCRPCLVELRAFEEERDQLRGAGLDIVALSVDGLGDKAGDRQAADKLVSRLKLSFATGVATDELMEKIQLLHDQLLETRRPLHVPTSILIDGDGRLAAIYKGPVEVAQLISDVQKLSLSSEDRLQASLPFAGRWFARPDVFRLAKFAQNLLAQGYVSEAADYAVRYHEQLSQDDKYPFLLADLGAAFESQGDLNSAVKYYRDAIKLKPGIAAAHAHLGAVLVSLERFEDAVVEYQQAIRLDPTLVVARFNLGISLGTLKKTDEAREHFLEVVKLEPNHALALANLALHAQQKGDVDQVIEYLKRFVAAKPDFASAHFRLAVLLEHSGRRGDAISEYREVLRIDANHASAPNNLAWILATHTDAQLRNGAEAVKLAERCASKYGDEQSGVLDTLAAAFAEAGRFSEAMLTAKKAIELAGLQGKQELSNEIKSRLAIYQNGEAFRAE